MTKERDFAMDESEAAFGLLAEFQNQAPILMEIEGHQSTRSAIDERIQKMGGRLIRYQVVRLVPTDCGNTLLFKDFLRMQE